MIIIIIMLFRFSQNKNNVNFLLLISNIHVETMLFYSEEIMEKKLRINVEINFINKNVYNIPKNR